MSEQFYNGRKVIWESKTKRLLLIAVSFIFVLTGIYTFDVSHYTISISIILFFGLGGLFFLYELINQKNLFVTYQSQLGKEILKQQAIDAQETLGFFTYSDDSFTFLSKLYTWNSISTVFAFKEDLITTDEICVDIFMADNSCFRVDESTPGWYQFIKRLNHQLSLSNEWEYNVMHPAFATNMTLLFDKQGRSKEQCETVFYS